MKRTYWLGLAALLLVPAAAQQTVAGPAENAASPLAQVPAKAPIVIHLRGFEQTKDRLIAMIKEALPELGGKAEEQINALLMQGLEGRSLKGLVKHGPIFVVFNDLPKSSDEEELKKKEGILIHVAKYAEFRYAIL